MSKAKLVKARREFLKSGTAIIAAALGTTLVPNRVSANDVFSVLSNLELIDLSVPMENRSPSETEPPRITYTDHDESVEAMKWVFECSARDLVYSKGKGWAVEDIGLSSHSGTHIDAPYHYGATSGGKPARKIDEVPLKWCFGPGVVLDLRAKKAGELITIDDLKKALERIQYRLNPLDIVMLHTGVDKKWGSKEYFRQPGLGYESTLWLVDQGIRMIGTMPGRWTDPLKT